MDDLFYNVSKTIETRTLYDLLKQLHKTITYYQSEIGDLNIRIHKQKIEIDLHRSKASGDYWVMTGNPEEDDIETMGNDMAVVITGAMLREIAKL